MLAVFSKEMRSYFTSAMGYIFMGVFLLMTGIFFALNNLGTSASPDYTGVLSNSSLLFLFLVPVITMRIISEETHQKTDQLLLTVPVSVTKVVVGKYLAAITLFLSTLLITCLNPLILSLFGKIAVAQTFGGILAFALMGAAFIAIGVFISAATENQVAAAVATFGVLLVLYLISGIKQAVPTTQQSGLILAVILVVGIATLVYFSTRNTFVGSVTGGAGIVAIVVIYIVKKTLFDGFTAKFISWFSLLDRFQTISAGILDVSSIVYYISVSFIFVFLAIRLIEKRRWS